MERYPRIFRHSRYPTISILSAVYLRHPVFVCRERIRPTNPDLRYRPICILRSCSHRSRGLFAALYSYDRIKRTSPSRNEQSCSIQPTRSYVSLDVHDKLVNQRVGRQAASLWRFRNIYYSILSLLQTSFFLEFFCR